MRIHEIEVWALTVIDRVKAGQPNEDSRVELKADWIDPSKAAHRIAAHGNEAHGEPFLWLIGVDEKTGVAGASLTDLAAWYQQVGSHFDGAAPAMKSANFTVDGSTVVALLFGSERAPFVVKNAGGSYPEMSVPLREGTRVRTARRDELLRLLSPLQRLPVFEPLGVSVEVNQAEHRRLCWTVAMKVYATTMEGNRVVIPFHRCRGELSFVSHPDFKYSFTKIQMSPFSQQSATVVFSGTEVVLNGPGMLNINGEFTIDDPHWGPGGDARVIFEITPVGGARPAIIDEIIPLALSRDRRWESGDLASA